MGYKGGDCNTLGAASEVREVASDGFQPTPPSSQCPLAIKPILPRQIKVSFLVVPPELNIDPCSVPGGILYPISSNASPIPLSGKAYFSLPNYPERSEPPDQPNSILICRFKTESRQLYDIQFSNVNGARQRWVLVPAANASIFSSLALNRGCQLVVIPRTHLRLRSTHVATTMYIFQFSRYRSFIPIAPFNSPPRPNNGTWYLVGEIPAPRTKAPLGPRLLSPPCDGYHMREHPTPTPTPQCPIFPRSPTNNDDPPALVYSSQYRHLSNTPTSLPIPAPLSWVYALTYIYELGKVEQEKGIVDVEFKSAPPSLAPDEFQIPIDLQIVVSGSRSRLDLLL
ncbi:uncharacterized protein BT62DRAFT_1079255 [Guyanagaster necrorhizus]|uniref:Uncharacterized protein n=1 Tax=Guyanagaster necrorhizus TaxID=856835 RepID=A0A9P8ANX7_9AGAR|nr:uncharacterized protein BT62DRAFT_1079255 [Guyanagaster necrorhizus MCA 3950]KAG7442385.1 hypothetical protein BT62DRAFT_1079255 [Guyanagaster necrorhizus MCA 3950]